MLLSTIFVAWELGGGLGHLVQLRPIADALLQRGHRLVVVLRDLSRARRIFGDGVTLLQAPVKTRPPDTPISPPFTFSHILHNLGYEHDDELMALASAWRNLFTTYKPDLAIFDHAPTALLASRGLPMRRMTIGSGFCLPPDQHPLPNLRPWKPADPQALIDHEQRTISARTHKTEKIVAVSRPFWMPLPRVDQRPHRLTPCSRSSTLVPRFT